MVNNLSGILFVCHFQESNILWITQSLAQLFHIVECTVKRFRMRIVIVQDGVEVDSHFYFLEQDSNDPLVLDGLINTERLRTNEGMVSELAHMT